MIRQGFSKFDEINKLEIGFPEKIDLITPWRVDFFSNIKSEFIEDILSVEDTTEEMKKRYLKNIEDAQIKGEVRNDLSPELIWLVKEKLNELVRDGSWKETFSDYSEFQKQYPVGHFDIYRGEVFDKAVTSQINFLKRVFLLQT